MPISKSEVTKQESTNDTENPLEITEEMARSNDIEDGTNHAEVGFH